MSRSATIPRLVRTEVGAVPGLDRRLLPDGRLPRVREESLPHLDESMVELVERPPFDELVVTTVRSTFPPHEHEQFVEHYRGLVRRGRATSTRSRGAETHDPRGRAAGGAPYPPWRLRRLGDPLEPGSRAGDRAGQGLLGVRPPRHGLGPARRGESGRPRRDLPLDGADPVLCSPSSAPSTLPSAAPIAPRGSPRSRSASTR